MVAICVLSFGRHEMTAKVLARNLNNAGIDHGLFVADMVGIAKASNTMLRRAYSLGYEYFCICGNDIQEDDGWLKARVDFINQTKDCGMVSVPVDHRVRGHASAEMVIGNFMISRKVVETIGAFDERFDPYGAIDLDYNKRCNKAGFINYYLPNRLANHLHYHDGKELYGYVKDDMVRKTWAIHSQDIDNYNIPLVEMEQMK